MALEDALLDILVCPIDKRGLLYFADEAVLYNPRLRWLYRIEDGIPLMLANQAVAVPEQEHERLMTCARRGEVTAFTAGQADNLAGDLVGPGCPGGGGYPGRGGGPWLRMILPSGLWTWLAPSGWTVRVQPSSCSTTWWCHQQ